MKVGFIGLGIMGKPMCRNLMKAGYEAVVYNRSKASVEELSAEGAQAAGSPAEVAENCQVIITMLPNSPQGQRSLFRRKRNRFRSKRRNDRD